MDRKQFNKLFPNDEATRQYLVEQARRASMSDVDIIIEDICRR